jgi:hypothetical protein
MNLMLKRAVAAGAIGGMVVAALVFGFCYWASTWEAVTPVSLTWLFRPWWRASNWVAAAVAFMVVAALLGARAACLTPLKDKK